VNLEALRNRVHELAQDAIGIHGDPAMLIVVGRLVETCEGLYEQAARLDVELRACKRLLDEAKA
jgi:hypothetical protein